MKKYLSILVFCLALVGYRSVEAADRRALMDSLTTIDPEIRKYFPRWKVCETDLQIQIYQAFRLVGYDEKLLNMSKIEILTAPHNDPLASYDLLLVTCGDATMNSAKSDRSHVVL